MRNGVFTYYYENEIGFGDDSGDAYAAVVDDNHEHTFESGEELHQAATQLFRDDYGVEPSEHGGGVFFALISVPNDVGVETPPPDGVCVMIGELHRTDPLVDMMRDLADVITLID